MRLTDEWRLFTVRVDGVRTTRPLDMPGLKAQVDKKGLKSARKAAGLTQKQLAAQSGVKLRAIQLYERYQLDLRRASVSSALALANALHCTIEELVWQPIALEHDS